VGGIDDYFLINRAVISGGLGD